MCVCVFVCVWGAIEKGEQIYIWQQHREGQSWVNHDNLYFDFLLLLDIIYDIFHVEYAWIDVEEGSIK